MNEKKVNKIVLFNRSANAEKIVAEAFGGSVSCETFYLIRTLIKKNYRLNVSQTGDFKPFGKKDLIQFYHCVPIGADAREIIRYWYPAKYFDILFDLEE